MNDMIGVETKTAFIAVFFLGFFVGILLSILALAFFLIEKK